MTLKHIANLGVISCTLFEYRYELGVKVLREGFEEYLKEFDVYTSI